MVLICAWCSRYLGMKDPLERVSLTHGICRICSARLQLVEGSPVRQSLETPTLVISRGRRDFLPVVQDLLQLLPEIRITLDRRVGERRREHRGEPPHDQRRAGDRRRGATLVLA